MGISVPSARVTFRLASEASLSSMGFQLYWPGPGLMLRHSDQWMEPMGPISGRVFWKSVPKSNILYRIGTTVGWPAGNTCMATVGKGRVGVASWSSAAGVRCTAVVGVCGGWGVANGMGVEGGGVALSRQPANASATTATSTTSVLTSCLPRRPAVGREALSWCTIVMSSFLSIF